MTGKNFLTMSENGKSEYCCSVVRIGELTPIEGSDFLAKTNVLGTQIVVRKDMVKEGDIMFYAANETALNQKFLSANNLFEIGCRDMNANAVEVNAIMEEYDTKYRNEADTLRAEAKQIKGLIGKYEKQVQKDKKKVSKLSKQLEEADDDTKKSEIQMQIKDLNEKIDAATKLALDKTVKYTDLKKKIETLVNDGKPIVDKATSITPFFLIIRLLMRFYQTAYFTAFCILPTFWIYLDFIWILYVTLFLRIIRFLLCAFQGALQLRYEGRY